MTKYFFSSLFAIYNFPSNKEVAPTFGCIGLQIAIPVILKICIWKFCTFFSRVTLSQSSPYTFKLLIFFLHLNPVCSSISLQQTTKLKQFLICGVLKAHTSYLFVQFLYTSILQHVVKCSVYHLYQDMIVILFLCVLLALKKISLSTFCLAPIFYKVILST